MRISDLADDVLIYILVRLPLESLGQFKCVSKSWNSLISTHKFINSHLNQSRIVQKPNVLLHNHEVDIQMAEFSITMDVHQDFDCNLKPIYRLPESLNQRHILQMVGSANGLLCLLLSPIYTDHYDSSDDYVFILCNPLTNSTWELPGNPWKKLFDYDSLFGFWYDDVHDDYKVMIMNLVLEKVGIRVYECQVYSLKSNSWNKVHSYLDFSFEYTYLRDDYGIRFRITCAGVLANCALHWILLDYNSTPIFILAFDLRTYKPNILPLPEDLGRLGINESLKLTVLNSSLALNFSSEYGDLCDSWIMNDYGLSNSWMKINIDTSFVGDALTPLALLENKHKRLVICFDNTHNSDDYTSAWLLQLIDLVSHQNQFIPAPSHWGHAKQLQFVGSLVQPYPPFVGHENVSSEEDRFENMLGSLDLVAGSESLIKEQFFNASENFDKFHIHVNGVSIDSQLPENVRRKYYDLCCRKKPFIHERLVQDIPFKVVVSMITEVVNIADSIRSCRFPTTSKEEVEEWEKSIRSFELLGMNVGFLCDRIRRLLCLAFDSEEGIEAKKFWEVKTKKSQMKGDIEDLEKRLDEMKEVYKNYGDEANERKPKAKSYQLMFQEEANAPW